MRLLLDTHVLLWWALDAEMIPARVAEAIVDPGTDKLVSAITAMELATKARIGKLPEARPLVDGFDDYLEQQGFDPLVLTARHALRAGNMAGEHRDPFDRMLAAQALAENLTLVSSDKTFDQFGVTRIW